MSPPVSALTEAEIATYLSAGVSADGNVVLVTRSGVVFMSPDEAEWLTDEIRLAIHRARRTKETT